MDSQPNSSDNPDAGLEDSNSKPTSRFSKKQKFAAGAAIIAAGAAGVVASNMVKGGDNQPTPAASAVDAPVPADTAPTERPEQTFSHEEAPTTTTTTATPAEVVVTANEVSQTETNTSDQQSGTNNSQNGATQQNGEWAVLGPATSITNPNNPPHPEVPPGTIKYGPDGPVSTPINPVLPNNK